MITVFRQELLSNNSDILSNDNDFGEWGDRPREAETRKFETMTGYKTNNILKKLQKAKYPPKEKSWFPVDKLPQRLQVLYYIEGLRWLKK